jgi:hypothetical protein
MVAVFFFSLLLLWFSSLELMVFSLGLEVVMARGRRLRKSGGGELEVNKQNVIASNEAIILPNVVIGDEAIVEPHVAT